MCFGLFVNILNYMCYNLVSFGKLCFMLIRLILIYFISVLSVCYLILESYKWCFNLILFFKKIRVIK